MLNSNKKTRSLLGLALAVVLIVGCLATSALAATIDNHTDVDTYSTFSLEGLSASSVITQRVEEIDTMPISEEMVEYTTTVDFSAAIPMNLAGGARAMKTINWSIPSQNGMRSVEAFSMEAGQTININVAVSPSSSNVRVGIIEPNGTFRYVLATSGSVNHNFSISTRGSYYVYVDNGSSYNVSVAGFVNY